MINIKYIAEYDGWRGVLIKDGRTILTNKAFVKDLYIVDFYLNLINLILLEKKHYTSHELELPLHLKEYLE